MVGTVVLPYSVQLFLVAAILFCISAFVYLVAEKKFFRTVRKGIWYALFFGVIAALSTWKYALGLSRGQEITFFTVYQMVVFAAYGCMVFGVLYHRKNLLPVLMGVLSCIITVLTFLCRKNFLYDLGVLRFMGAYTNPNIFGIYAVTAFFASVYMLLSHMPLKTLWVINAGVSIGGILLTASRTAVIATAAGLCVLVIFSAGRIRQIRWKQVLVTLLALLCVVCATFLVMRPMSMDDLHLTVGSELSPSPEEMPETQIPEGEQSTPGNQTGGLGIAGTTEGMTEMWNHFMDRFALDGDGNSSIKHNLRLRIWVEYLRILPKYFSIGTDYTLADRPIVNGDVRDPHNTLIYTMFRFGIGGIISLLLMLAVVNIRLLRWKKKHENVAVQAMLIALLIISLLNDLLNTPIFFVVIAFAYVVSLDKADSGVAPSRPKRVLQVFSSLNKGGAESRTMDILRKLDRNEVILDFAVTSDHVESHFFYDEILSLGAKVYPIPSWRKTGLVSYFRSWSNLIRENDYRIVHCHAGVYSAIPMYIAWLNNVPKRIAHARDSSVDNGGALSVKINRWITNAFANCRIYCSKEAAEFAFGAGAVGRPRTYFLPNATDMNRFAELTQEQKLALKQSLGLKDGCPVIGTVGNARPVKNHIFLAKVFHQLLSEQPDAMLVIVGNDAEDSDTKQYIQENGFADSVVFTGVRDDIGELIQIFDVFMLPSLREGAPGSVIEAQAANVPCILSDTITHAVDVGTGLVSYLSLNAPLTAWTGEIMRCCRMEKPVYGASARMLRDAGYDNANSMQMLLDIYKI